MVLFLPHVVVMTEELIMIASSTVEAFVTPWCGSFGGSGEVPSAAIDTEKC
jgi:hypothetical protein